MPRAQSLAAQGLRFLSARLRGRTAQLTQQCKDIDIVVTTALIPGKRNGAPSNARTLPGFALPCLPSPPRPSQRGLNPQLGDMDEILVAFSGAIGSGYRHLPQAADAVLDQTEEVTGKLGTEKSSRPCLVDCGEGAIRL